MILVDPRVGTKHGQSREDRLAGIVKSLGAKVRTRVKAAKPALDAGDFYFAGKGPTGEWNIGVEWKTLPDFLGSMRTGRLAGDQIVKMSEAYDMSFVIVQGVFGPDSQGRLRTRRGKEWVPVTVGTKECFRYSELFKHWISLCVKKNVMVFRSGSEDETLWQIAHLYDWFQVEWDEHNSTDPIKLNTEMVFTRVSLLRKMAAELPGIGWKRSREVEKAFGSVQGMVEASVAEWEAIDGIGKTTAQKVWKALREVV